MMLTYTVRRLILAVPTLVFIALVIFLLLDMAPGEHRLTLVDGEGQRLTRRFTVLDGATPTE